MKLTNVCCPAHSLRLVSFFPCPCAQLSRWMVSALQRPSVGATFKSPEAGASYKDKLLEHYVRYADGTANSTSAAKFG